MKKIIRKISLLLYVGIMLKLIPTMNKFILGEFHYQKNALLATFQLVKGQKKHCSCWEKQTAYARASAVGSGGLYKRDWVLVI